MYTPTIDPTSIRNLLVVVKLFQEQPDYFKEGPYSLEIEELVKRLAGAPRATQKGTEAELDVDNINVLAEIKATYKSLNEHKPDISDAAATMGYYRTRTSLLDKLLEQMERGKNQKQISEFYSTVIEILEEIATPTQRTIFQDRLKEFANQ